MIEFAIGADVGAVDAHYQRFDACVIGDDAECFDSIGVGHGGAIFDVEGVGDVVGLVVRETGFYLRQFLCAVIIVQAVGEVGHVLAFPLTAEGQGIDVVGFAQGVEGADEFAGFDGGGDGAFAIIDQLEFGVVA